MCLDSDPASVTSSSGTADGDPMVVLLSATSRITVLTAELLELSAARRAAVAELHAAGHSHAEIAALAGLSRGRIHQLLH